MSSRAMAQRLRRNGWLNLLSGAVLLWAMWQWDASMALQLLVSLVVLVNAVMALICWAAAEGAMLPQWRVCVRLATSPLARCYVTVRASSPAGARASAQRLLRRGQLFGWYVDTVQLLPDKEEATT